MDVERMLELAKGAAVLEVEARFMGLMGVTSQLQMIVDEVMYAIEEAQRSQAAPAETEG